MILKLFSTNGTRIIHLDKSFFAKQNNSKNPLTPKEKARQLGKDLYGGEYTGHILEFNGKVIQNTLAGKDKNHVHNLQAHSQHVGPDRGGKSTSDQIGSNPIGGHLPNRYGHLLKD